MSDPPGLEVDTSRAAPKDLEWISGAPLTSTLASGTDASGIFGTEPELEEPKLRGISPSSAKSDGSRSIDNDNNGGRGPLPGTASPTCDLLAASSLSSPSPSTLSPSLT